MKQEIVYQQDQLDHKYFRGRIMQVQFVKICTLVRVRTPLCRIGGAPL